MAEKSTIAKMYTDLVNALDGVVESEFIFVGGRPDIKDPDIPPMKKYVVIQLPVGIEDMAAGNNKFHLTTTGVFYLISEAKSNRTFKLDSLSDFTEEVIDKFPIKGEYIVASNPAVLMSGMDEYGYQIVTVTFDVHNK